MSIVTWPSCCRRTSRNSRPRMASNALGKMVENNDAIPMFLADNEINYACAAFLLERERNCGQSPSTS